MKKEHVILVNKQNRKLGTMEKIQAHREGKLHRAFSIFIFNTKGELLIQQRKKTKYHSGGLWSNTVCSHPRSGETYLQAVHRRLKEEVGFDCPVKKQFCFIYDTGFKNGLTENEYDCVYAGIYDGVPQPNPKEIMAIQWIPLTKLKKEIKKYPRRYSVWLKIALPSIKAPK